MEPLQNLIKSTRFKLIVFLVLVYVGIKVFFPSNLFNSTYSTVLLDRNGHLLSAKIAKDEQWRFPASDTLPYKYKECVRFFEDEYFYYHPGINPVSVGRALFQNVRSGEVKSGGSTITMQLARMSRGNAKRTFIGKLWESILAFAIEVKISKSNILKQYATHAPFGGNVVGLEAASWRYFGLPSYKLSWAESATLAVLPNAPSLIFPGKNQNILKEKRDRLLKKLWDKGVIDQLTYTLSVDEEVPTTPYPIPQWANHLLNKTIIDGNGEKRLTTTLDVNIQKNVAHVLERHTPFLRSNQVYNVAVLVCDVETGNILSYVGNTGVDKSGLYGSQIDMIQVARSSGSILKPFLYASMMNDGLLLPNQLIKDVPSYYDGFTPKNYSKTYGGAVPAHKCLSKSLNVPSVIMLKEFGIDKFIDRLNRIGFTSVNRSADYYGLSLILGGAEVRLWDAVGAYSSMSRTLNHYTLYNGLYNKEDIHELRYIDEPEPEVNEKNLVPFVKFSAGAIWFTYDALLKVNRPVEDANWQMFHSSKKIAWKTGTSFGLRDAWAIGTTPQYTIGVWVGNADNVGRPELVGVNAAAPIMFDVLNLLPMSNTWFDKPYDEMVEVPVCPKSGYRKSMYCNEYDSIWIMKKALESPSCPYHIQINLNRQGYQVNSGCSDVSDITRTNWFILPPLMEWYYKKQRVDYKTVPPFKSGCISSSNVSMDIVYPPKGSSIFIPKDFDGKSTKIILEAVHRRPEAIIYWHLNHQYLGETRKGHTMAIQEEPGSYVLTLVDDLGEEQTVNFQIVE